MKAEAQVSLRETTSPTHSNAAGGLIPATSSVPDQVGIPKQGSSPGEESRVISPSESSAFLVVALIVAGSYSLFPIWIYLIRLWLTDPLRAIGAVFPLLSFAGIMIAWRRIGWNMDGTLWGLPILATSVILARVSSSLVVDFSTSGGAHSILQAGLVMFLFGLGAILLFGGTQLLRASIAPLCLLLCVVPVPPVFNRLVDLPLQFLSANTARHFAHLIGLQPTGEQLQMMFSPNFGMMIVPGCNGVRGSVTLGYLALIFGYIRHLRPRVLTLATLGAFLAGYALNLVRLCTLVIYYRIGLTHPSIQPYGAGVDYAIGCTLFLFATLGVGLFIRWIEPKASPQPDRAIQHTGARNFRPSTLRFGRPTVVHMICFLIVVLPFIVPKLKGGSIPRVSPPSEQAVASSFPRQVGPYQLVRTYAEIDANGLLQFVLADYSASASNSAPARNLTFGLYVGLGSHMIALSRFAQGLTPVSTASFDATDASMERPMAVHYALTLYDDSSRREYDAESACYEAGCSASIDSRSKRFFFSAPKISDFVHASNGKHMNVLFRRELPDSDRESATVMQSQFESDVRQFTEQLNLRALLRTDGTSI